MHHRNIFLTQFFTFTMVVCEGLYGGQLQSQFLFSLRRNVHDIGLSSLLAGICEIVAVFPVAYLADKIGKVKVIWAGAIIGLVAIAVNLTGALLTLLPALYVAIALWGVDLAVYNPSIQAIFSDSIPPTANSSKFFSFVWALSNVAAALGSLVPIPLFLAFGNEWDRTTLKTIIGVGLGVALLPIVSLFFFKTPPQPSDSPETGRNVEMATVSPETTVSIDAVTTVEHSSEVSVQDSDSEVAQQTCAATTCAATIDASPQVAVSAPAEMEESVIPQVLNSEETVANPVESERPRPRLLRRAVPFLLVGADLLAAFAGGVVVGYFPIYMSDRLMMGPITVALIYFGCSVGATGGSLLAPLVARRLGRAGTILLYHSFGLVFLLGAALFRSQALFTICFVMRYENPMEQPREHQLHFVGRIQRMWGADFVSGSLV
ncbi:hypothetical protein PAPYR_2850 [Paratrimastix pyriformis]|uniref:Major facilitator superfamily (MFS) profile domain-containing protein n=1 Tax=Paratrimastix pyriformis TaxID=342808 RepID=A0ABQ8UP82_9EUKA|nr:hypothetical protein PAPYR_2850 [Paratrimastix pyriformis]